MAVSWNGRTERRASRYIYTWIFRPRDRSERVAGSSARTAVGETAAPGSVEVSVVVCTRNRPGSLADTVASVLRSDHDSFELLVIDQSTDDRSRAVLAPWISDPRLRFISTDTVGLSVARNIGAAEATAQVVLMTDDDCTVHPTWVATMSAALTSDAQVACVYSDVLPGPHDPELGFIPFGQQDADRRFDRIRGFDPGVGIGASVGYERQALTDAGGFDELLGAGARYKSAEEVDLAIRLLGAGRSVRYITSTNVVHYGFRTHDESRFLIRGYMYGSSAALTKLLKCGHVAVVFPFARMLWDSVGVIVVHQLRERHLPPVIGRVQFILKGAWGALRTPVDRRTGRFRTN